MNGGIIMTTKKKTKNANEKKMEMLKKDILQARHQPTNKMER